MSSFQKSVTHLLVMEEHHNGVLADLRPLVQNDLPQQLRVTNDSRQFGDVELVDLRKTRGEASRG